MTKTNKSKKALVSSVIALVLCMAMLVGTTFAWFTDSVTSGKNQIVAGNLDIELEYLVDGKWVAVDGDTNIFEEGALWEPGHTEVVSLRVRNAGTLALKYQLGINVFEEITSINVAGEELRLSDYIEFGIVEGQFTDRAAARAAVKNAMKLSTGYNVDQVSLLPGASEEITMVVYMPESVGNEANYKTGYEAPQINLGIKLMATQLVYEEDSFGPDYDKDAIFGAIPGATVVKKSEKVTAPLYNLGNLSTTGEFKELDVAYEFATTQSYDQAMQNQYAKWNADFVVTFDKDVDAASIVMAGYYESWCEAHTGGNWLGFELPDDVAAGQPVRLLGSAGITANYEELCLMVQEFSCGVADVGYANAGTTMSVELRLYETYKDDTNSTQENGNSLVVGSYSYTFENPADLPQATVAVAPEFVGTNLNWNNQYNQVSTDTKLESAYVFTANEIDPVNYAKWSADFEVSVDRDITDGQLILAGQYDAFSLDWIGFEAPATAANEKVALLGTAGIHVNYEEICNYIKTFNCGVADVDDALAGATITVELVLTSPDGTESYVVSTNTYTF